MLLLLSADFSKKAFPKNAFRNTNKVLNGLDPDQHQHSVGPDLGPNCLKGYKQMPRRENISDKIKTKVISLYAMVSSVGIFSHSRSYLLIKITGLVGSLHCLPTTT